MNLYKNAFLTEGGGGGHIKHPYEIVSNGEQLLNLFGFVAAKANEPSWLREYASTKIDGVNGIFKLCHYDGTLQFCLDRGSADEMDVRGVSVKEIPERFKGEERPAYTMALQLLNRMLPYIHKNLQALGMEPGNQVGLNCDVNMPGVTNVVKYDAQYPFITIHDMVEMVVKPESQRGARKSVPISYDRSSFKEMIMIMDETAQKRKWRIFHKIPVGVKKTFNLNEPLKWQLNVDGKRGTLRRFITNVQNINPKDVNVKNYKKVLISKEAAEPNEIDGAVIFLANMGLGQYILDNLNFSNLSSQHEGIIVYDPALKHKIKLTGNFMVNRLNSPFAKNPKTESVRQVSDNVIKEMKLAGIYINGNWGDLILSGRKLIETRGVPLPQRWHNQKLFILKDTDRGRIATGTVGFSHSRQYNNYSEWRADVEHHLVDGSEFDFHSRKKTFAWYIIPEMVQKFKKPVLISQLNQKIKHTPGGVFEPFEVPVQESFKAYVSELNMQQLAAYEPPTVTNADTGETRFDLYVDENELLDVFERLYEFEYKWSMVDLFPIFGGNLKRKENIAKRLKDGARPVVDYIAKTLENVIGDWLSKHAITEPEEWAEARVRDYFNDMGNFGGDVHPADIEMIADELDSEYRRYIAGDPGNAYGRPGNGILQTNTIYRLMDNSPQLKKTLGYMAEQENQYGYYEDDDEEYAEQTAETMGEYFESMGGSFGEFIRSLAESPTTSTSEIHTILVELYTNIVFELWYDYWRGQGIDKTRELVEKAYKDLQDIKARPLKEQFKIINIAINTAHQNGEMMEYYEEQYGISKSDLDEFNKEDSLVLKNWNQELRLMGIQIPENKYSNFKTFVREELNA